MDSMIFDVDGTLWDSTPVVAEAWTEYLKGEGVPLRITADILKAEFGKLLPDIAADLFCNETKERQLFLIEGCCEAEHRALRKQCGILYPALKETLTELSRHLPLFIVSNCQAGYIEVFLEATGFGDLFRDHLCPGDTGLAKADNIRLISEKHRLQSPVYIGDTAGDARASEEAGVPFIFASYGFGDVPSAGMVIREPRDLLSFL